jgi:hypothetical protein
MSGFTGMSDMESCNAQGGRLLKNALKYRAIPTE